MNGLKKAIRYSLKPHELGLCGPQCVLGSKKVLREFALGKKYPIGKIREIMKEFHGASDYYSLIAEKNGIRDIFDERVIDAYWIGNSLLDKVKPADIKEMILKNFVKPEFINRKQAEKIIVGIRGQARPHHSFHVFFVGSITGRVKITPKLKDVCRVSGGRVTRILSDQVEVQTEKLFPKIRKINLKIGWDKMLLPKLKIGDFVTFHWRGTSQKINKGELSRLNKYTMINYKALKKI